MCKICLISGELIGGLDILREMATEGELKDILPQVEEKISVNDRIKVSVTTRAWHVTKG